MLRALPFAVLALLPACARDDAAYPSLAPRPVERLGFEEPEPPASQPVEPDPQLDVEIAAATARLDKAQADFDAAARGADAAARRARGAAAGDERWIDAQTALAGLDVLRVETSDVLTDLEQLAIDRAVALAPAYPALETARTRARTELGEQDATIRRIGAALAPA
ncbi:hypothetical protein [Sphingomonas lenta]|uniref:DUF4398 domain-containing protein n=1 Tax=Sphingomonas lenta TaxID=1141887 RepID=A0A2A2SGV9_9SPHN|nr:hypothetical protein [Sphingomonas lenta]PAX08497.1 hypothetical protein CKY28_03675 [Sphingomonas lenta]